VKRVGQEYVVLPQLGPRYEDEKEANLETEKYESDCKKAIHRHLVIRGQKSKSPDFDSNR
jgi:hypothetical protein